LRHSEEKRLQGRFGFVPLFMPRLGNGGGGRRFFGRWEAAGCGHGRLPKKGGSSSTASGAVCSFGKTISDLLPEVARGWGPSWARDFCRPKNPPFRRTLWCFAASSQFGGRGGGTDGGGRDAAASPRPKGFNTSKWRSETGRVGPRKCSAQKGIATLAIPNVSGGSVGGRRGKKTMLLLRGARFQNAKP